jgi:hypothetical protein
MPLQEPSDEEVRKVIESAAWNRDERRRLEARVRDLEAQAERTAAKHAAEIKALRQRVEFSEHREATLDDDYQEARREVTVITTLIDQIMDTCQAALAQASVARHGFATERRAGEKGVDAVARALNIDPKNPPIPMPRTVNVNVPRPNRLVKMVDDLQDEPMPSFLRRPMEGSRDPLVELAETLAPSVQHDEGAQ